MRKRNLLQVLIAEKGSIYVSIPKVSQIYAKGQYPDFSLAFRRACFRSSARNIAFLNGKLLDVACGEGTFAVQAAQKGWSVMGMDQSEEMLNLARKQSPRQAVDEVEKIGYARSRPLR